MQNSLWKYLSKPIVQQTSKTSLDEIEKPIIYVCQDNQFQYSKSIEYGYKYLEDIIRGDIGNGKISWKGKHGNLTYRELQKCLYQYNYTNPNLAAWEYVNKTWIEESSELELGYIPAYGFCMNLKNDYLSHIAITGKKDLTFFIADPSTASRLKISHVGNGIGSLRQNHDSGYRYSTYHMDITLNDAHIYEGSECRDYSKIGTSYGECIYNTLEQKLIEWYGCIAPWFPKNTSLVCEEDIEIKMKDEMARVNALDQLWRLGTGQDLSIFSTCLKPCLTLDLKLRLVHESSYLVNEGWVEISLNDEVVVHTAAIAYDMFNLVVDLGSALGLWLGLSALSIFDTILQVLGAHRKKIFMFLGKKTGNECKMNM